MYKITDKGIEKLINMYDIHNPGSIDKATIALLEYLEENKEKANFIGMRKAWRYSLGFSPGDMRIHPMGDNELHHTIDHLITLNYITKEFR